MVTPSALYEGTVAHRRREPSHSFTAPLALPCLALDDLTAVAARSRLWSVEGRNVVSFRRADLLGPVDVPLDEAVRHRVADQVGRVPTGPIRVLAHLRTWGFLFNPLALYLCADEGGTTRAAVLEVTNTPWHERHAYVVDGLDQEHRFAKELHVSPFFGMGAEYRCRLVDDGERIDLRLDLVDGERTLFESHLDLRRRPLDAAAMRRVAWDLRRSTLAGSAGIYAQALRLRRAGARFHPHPDRAARRDAGRADQRAGGTRG